MYFNNKPNRIPDPNPNTPIREAAAAGEVDLEKGQGATSKSQSRFITQHKTTHGRERSGESTGIIISKQSDEHSVLPSPGLQLQQVAGPLELRQEAVREAGHGPPQGHRAPPRRAARRPPRRAPDPPGDRRADGGDAHARGHQVGDSQRGQRARRDRSVHCSRQGLRRPRGGAAALLYEGGDRGQEQVRV